ncbi:hypothetical protein [Cohnella rhizosphaerae]|uniref:Uncharacterized protein n=1 Tax=Cohnella rhizosphaerae TaxID=1457232 RepID=A0A9X4QWW8_9BACL|nr:hypothetical protein [Cohnella rhizosphaerae]MDG0814240.1 hypothetical protein [Cohnella rhizosphaerae]
MFYGILRIRWNAVRRHHRLLNRFSLITFFAHTLLIKLNLLALGWTYVETNVPQELLVSCLALAQCGALTYAWMRLDVMSLRGRSPSVESDETTAAPRAG